MAGLSRIRPTLTSVNAGHNKKEGEMPKKILWLSGHEMNGIQMCALRRMFGADVELVEQVGWVGNADQIVETYQRGGFDDLIIVAPMSVIAKVVEAKIHPLWSEAVICSQGQHDWETNGRYYRFARFRRIRRLAFEFEDLGPAAVRQATDRVDAEQGGSDLPGWRRMPIEQSRQGAVIPSQLLRDEKRGHISREVMETIRRIARESEAAELFYLSHGQRDRGGDQLHPNCRVYSLPGRVLTASGEKPWYYGEPQPEGRVFFGTHLIVDPGTLSPDEAVSRTLEHLATVEIEAGMVESLLCEKGPYRGAHLGQVQFGQKSEERLLSADGKIIGWGAIVESLATGAWTTRVKLRLFHPPYPADKMVWL